MKTVYLFLCFSIVTLTSSAQTKVIAFKSHSGNIANFNLALSNELFADEGSNFGLPTNKENYQLIRVVYLSKSKAVLTKKVFTRAWNQPKDSAHYITTITETVYNHPLFSKKHALDSIRQVLKTSDEYGGSANEIIFVGYDNGKKNTKNKPDTLKSNDQRKENEIIPVTIVNNPGNNNNLFDKKMVQALSLIVLLSLLGAFLSWKVANYTNKKGRMSMDKLAIT